MKGLSKKIVLAAIILSCGFVMQIGSTAGHRDGSNHSNQKQGPRPASWLPSGQQQRTVATVSFAPARQQPH